MQEIAIQIHPLSTSSSLSNYLSDFEVRSEQAARQNLEAALITSGGDIESYTVPEIRAMVKLEQLKLVGDLSLAEVLLRGKIIKEIEDEALWSIHPNRYPNMQTAAKAQGISISEYSNIRDLYNIVFPYLIDTLGMNLALVWEEVGKSNLRELTPYLVCAITGQPSQSRNVGVMIDQMMDDSTEEAQRGGQIATESQVRQSVVQQLMETGRLTNREVRQRIRNPIQEDIPIYIMEIHHHQTPQKVLVSFLNDQQYSLVQRRLQGIITPIQTNLPDLMLTPLGDIINSVNT